MLHRFIESDWRAHLISLLSFRFQPMKSHAFNFVAELTKICHRSSQIALHAIENQLLRLSRKTAKETDRLHKGRPDKRGYEPAKTTDCLRDWRKWRQIVTSSSSTDGRERREEKINSTSDIVKRHKSPASIKHVINCNSVQGCLAIDTPLFAQSLLSFAVRCASCEWLRDIIVHFTRQTEQPWRRQSAVFIQAATAKRTLLAGTKMYDKTPSIRE